MRNAADREQQLDAILQAVADAILIVDTQGVVRYANAAAATIFGRPLSEIVGQDFGFPMVPGENTEVDIVRPGGSVIVGELRTVDTQWEDELAHVASIRDITARKRAAENAQRLLREQMARGQAEDNEKRARFLVDAANALSGSLDYSVTLNDLARVCVEYYADWCVIDVVETNQEVKRVAVAQVDPAQAELARKLGELSPEKHPLPHEVEVLRSGEPLLVSTIERRAQDEEYQKVIDEINPRCGMIVPLVSRNRTLGVIALVSAHKRNNYTQADLDIVTELGRHAATAIDNSRLYQEAQRGNEAKSNFLAIMSHELRTPLNAVIGYSDLLTMGVPTPIPRESVQHVNRIRSSARHLLRLIEEILTFSRMEAGREYIEFSYTPISVVGRDVASIIKPLAAEKNLEFIVNLPEPDYEIHTDIGKVEQILLNLLSNAVKFTPSGKVELTIVPADNWTHFHVKDSGIGIAPEHLDRIFDPFWQAEQSRTRRAEGTGLGLSVARRLAQLLGGNLVVQSTAHKGSTFTLQLPNRAPVVNPNAE